MAKELTERERLLRLVCDAARLGQVHATRDSLNGQVVPALEELLDNYLAASKARLTRDLRMESAAWLLEHRWITYDEYQKADAAMPQKDQAKEGR